MSINRIISFKWFFLLAVLYIALTGCAVLTDSQIQEVKKFSESTKAYNELPGALAHSYGELVRDRDLLEISRVKFSSGNTELADNAWGRLVKASDKEKKLITEGDRMDAALAVLKEYSDILGQLVSDTYTNSLGENAAKLGTSLNNAIDAYNNKYNTSQPLPKPGGDIAYAIRASGGIFIRARQTKVLKDTIEKANPLIKSLMNNVEEIAQKQSTDYQNYQGDDMKRIFTSIANESGRLTVNTIAFVYNDLSRASAGEILAKKVENAAKTYAAAHEALYQKTRQKEDLKEFIAEIQTLQNEVKAARDIKSKVSK